MKRRFFTGRQLRQLREYLTAYLMIAPATVLIFAFGIFPVGFALYVSLHKWRIKKGEFRGLTNYLKAIDNLTYVLLFALALGAIIAGFLILRRIILRIREENPGNKVWLLTIPGAALSAAAYAFVRWSVLLLPEVLAIADKIWGLEKTRQLFMGLLKEAFLTPRVVEAWRLFLGSLLISLILSAAAFYLVRGMKFFQYLAQFFLAWIVLPLGGGLLWVTFQDVQSAYQTALEEGTDPGIWPQVITISCGVLLLIGAWKLWSRAADQRHTWSFLARIVAAVGLLIGAWLLIGELPRVIASGDKGMWNGLKVTAFYSLGTVPFQLGFSMFLAILLFQNLWGSELFRMLFFLPYVTPTVASAAIFRQLFSNRYQAPVNQLLIGLGLEPLQWVREPQGIFSMMADAAGIGLPEWAAGPSLALVVIMIYSIWTYVGYDTVIYLAGLGNISTAIIEAAEIDGAGGWEKFRYIIFPLLSPTTYFLSLIAIIGTFKAFSHIWVMRQGSALGTTDTFSVVIFSEFFEKLRYGYASALAFVLFAIILSLTLINQRLQGDRVFYG
ncbi:MAG: sugar ABC transporter permease [Anaerolineales bacterium]|nr:sugar ABC transporter permease [Anaerolineales bacterium]